MNVLIIGNGGREHALAWKVARSPRVEQVLVAPGNAGTAREPGMENVAVDATDIDGLVALARDRQVDLTIVGPEAPLAAGLVDRFQSAGLACFGPRADAARLESSKAFAKDFMVRHQIPTAGHATVDNVADGLKFARTIGFPLVLKADGLAAGKGVVIVDNEDQARSTLEDMLSGQSFGAAGHRVVVEEFLVGEEASFIVIAANRQVLPLASSQDHKRRDDGDRGPNTGGMGAYSPAPAVSEDVHDTIMADIIRPTLDGLASDGCPFTGFLYAGVMLTAAGPRVLEFNVRFGDPETQPVMMRLESDLVDLVEAALEGRLDRTAAKWDRRVALGVVLAAGGYPQDYARGEPISGLDTEWPGHVKVFHAGTAIDDNGSVVTSGGRVLCLTALGDDVAQAQAEAYRWLAHIGFRDAYHRTDIGFRAIGRD